MVSIKNLLIVAFAAVAIAAPAASPLEHEIEDSFNKKFVAQQGANNDQIQKQACGNGFRANCCNVKKGDATFLSAFEVLSGQCNPLQLTSAIGILGGAGALGAQKQEACTNTVACCQEGNNNINNNGNGNINIVAPSLKCNQVSFQ